MHLCATCSSYNLQIKSAFNTLIYKVVVKCSNLVRVTAGNTQAGNVSALTKIFALTC